MIKSTDQGESSTGDTCKPLWKRLWHFNLPTKIKVFAWRACIKGLPTMDALFNRRISQNKVCPICGNEAENIDHALIGCDFSSLVWNLWPESPLRMQSFEKSFLDLALFILSCSTPQDLDLFFATA